MSSLFIKGSMSLRHVFKATTLASAFVVSLLSGSSVYAADDVSSANELYICNWSDYIDPQVLTDFTEETGIKVHYDLMDSNEILEAKLMAGKTGYDIVAPSIHILNRLIKLNLLHPLDKEKLPNMKHLDQDKMQIISDEADEGNKYGIPYVEIATALAYNERKVAEIMGPDFKVDSWNVLFDEKLVSKLQKCGVSSLDAPADMLASALIYLGLDPETTSRSEYDRATEVLKVMAKHVAYFHSSKYIDDLASGEICLAAVWANDAEIANVRSLEAGKDRIKVIIPKEGALIGFDMFAIPADARHVDNAHKFLDYIMRPEVMAQISNHIYCANVNASATPLVNESIRENNALYYDKETLKRVQLVIQPHEAERIMTRAWNRVIRSSKH